MLSLRELTANAILFVLHVLQERVLAIADRCTSRVHVGSPHTTVDGNLGEGVFLGVERHLVALEAYSV